MSDYSRYDTTCPQCGKLNILFFNIYRRKCEFDEAVYYKCLHCGQSGKLKKQSLLSDEIFIKDENN